MSGVWTPPRACTPRPHSPVTPPILPPLTQPPQLAPCSTHLTSLHFTVNPLVSRISDGMGKCCTSYFVSNSQNIGFSWVVFGDSVVCGERIVPAFSGVSFGLLKGKSDRHFNGGRLLHREFTWQPSVKVWHCISGSKKLHQLGTGFTLEKSQQFMRNKMEFHSAVDPQMRLEKLCFSGNTRASDILFYSILFSFH